MLGDTGACMRVLSDMARVGCLFMSECPLEAGTKVKRALQYRNQSVLDRDLLSEIFYTSNTYFTYLDYHLVHSPGACDDTVHGPASIPNPTIATR